MVDADRENLEAAMPQPERRMREALDSATRLLQDDVVEGVGQGETADGEPCVVVMVSSRPPDVDKRIPESIEGVPVEVVVTGTFTAGG